MTSKNRRWLTAAVATVGAGALTFGGAVLPAAAESSDEIAVATPDKFQVAAANIGVSVSEVEKLASSESVEITDQGFVLHRDPAADPATVAARKASAEVAGAAIPGTPEAGSRAGAPVTIYLDFDGEVLTETAWNDDAKIASLDFGGAANANAGFRHDVWAAVAEDYAPFNVNVTTADPGADKLYKTSVDDNEYGVHVIITDSYDEVLPDAFGTAGLGYVSAVGSEYLTGALVFTVGVGGGDPADASAKSVADTASHEAGHNFGLSHAGYEYAPDLEDEYYSPTTGVWGPIMGSTYDVPVSQWTNGSYNNSTTDEGELELITDRGIKKALDYKKTRADGSQWTGVWCYVIGEVDPNNLKPGDVVYESVNGECNTLGAPLTVHFTYVDRADYVADDFGNDIAGAATLANTTGTFGTPGLIGRTGDVDVFRVGAAAGTFSATVDVADIGPNLDATLTLTNGAGNVIATSNPDAIADTADVASGLGASISADVEPGLYYLTVRGGSYLDPSLATRTNSNGFTDYGNLGNYTLSGEAEPLQTVVIDTPADGSAVADGEEVEVTGTASPGATITLTVDGTAVATAEVDEDGNWTATVTSHAFGNTVIVASQTVGSDVLPETDTVTVTAPVAAPVVTAPADGSTTDDNTPTLSGTGIPGSTVAITLTSASGGTIVTSATVNAEGNWSVDVAEAIGNGVYTVSATQSINGVTSAASEEVSFTVNAVITNPDTGANGNGTGTGNNTGELATTGGDFSSMLIVALIAAALVAGGGAAAFGLRRKKVASES